MAKDSHIDASAPSIAIYGGQPSAIDIDSMTKLFEAIKTGEDEADVTNDLNAWAVGSKVMGELDTYLQYDVGFKRTAVDEKQPVPTLAQIKACIKGTRSAPLPNGVSRLLQMGAYVVKYGTSSGLSTEADTLQFLARNCPSVSAPRLHALYVELLPQRVPTGDPELDYAEDDSIYYVVMNHVNGRDLENTLFSYSAKELAQITRKLRQYIATLREISPSDPAYIGALKQKPCTAYKFKPHPLVDIKYLGPFETHEDMVEGMVRRCRPDTSNAHMRLLYGIAQCLSAGDYRVKFTHGDLLPKNVMVHRNNNGELDVTIIDWESAGWYPEYWEFTATMSAAILNPMWMSMAAVFLGEHFYKEYPYWNLLNHMFV